MLGFFDDYTDILETRSYSTTFFMAIVLQILTSLTFALKDRTVGWFREREGAAYRVALVVCVWLIMFLSKFVFLAVINVVFGHAVDIGTFVGLMAIIMCMTICRKVADWIFRALAD